MLAWVNDEKTKRAYGSRTDAYAVFARMLKNGHPPDDWAGPRCRIEDAGRSALLSPDV